MVDRNDHCTSKEATVSAIVIDSDRAKKRHRHRSYKRKAAGSLGLVFITPFVLFAILAFSVQAIEYDSTTRPGADEVPGLDQYAGLRDTSLTSALVGRPYSR